MSREARAGASRGAAPAALRSRRREGNGGRNPEATIISGPPRGNAWLRPLGRRQDDHERGREQHQRQIASCARREGDGPLGSGVALFFGTPCGHASIAKRRRCH